MADKLATWARIEPHARSTDLAAGLAAEMADPLWLLARQLQLGELTGTDGGSPAVVDIQTSWSRFTRFQPGRPAGNADTVQLGHVTGPIEALVEREAILVVHPGDASRRDDNNVSAPFDWAARVRAGRSLNRFLRSVSLHEVADAMATHPQTCFQPGEASPQHLESAVDDRYRRLLAGRVIDAVRVLALLSAGAGLPGEVTANLDADDKDRLNASLDEWSLAMDREWGVASGQDRRSRSWSDDRLEYAFRVAAPPLPPAGDGDLMGATELVFEAESYDGSGIEWYSLDLAGGATLGAAADVETVDSVKAVGTRWVRALPQPLTYPGMPADRFWEMEDSAISYGEVTAGPTDLAALLAVDFAIVYSPEWYIAPVEVPVGAVARIDWIAIRDTFGVATLVGTCATQSGDGVGRQFQPSNIDGSDGDHPLLVVVPSSMGALRSDTRELVSFQRDEAANLAWGIERVAMGPTGRGVDRPWFPSDFAAPDAESHDPFELLWRLSTPVASTWIPLVAVVDADGRRLVRAGLLDSATDQIAMPVSQLLNSVDSLRDEEVTRSGVQVRVVEQLARWYDGSTYCWRGRESRPSGGEASSKLRFDGTFPPKA